MKAHLLKYSIIFLFLSTTNLSAQWSSIAPVYNGTLANDGAASFSIGGKGYVVAGSSTSLLYSYDPSGNSWTPLGNIPVNAGHAFAMSFVINDKAYIIGGDTGGVPMSTVWQFDPAAPSGSEWEQKNDFPGGVRDAGFAFTIGNTGYAGAGFDGANLYTDVWKYDAAQDHWSQLSSDIPANGLLFPSSFVIGNKGYVLFGGTAPSGLNELNSMWCIDGGNDSIYSRAQFPGVARQAGFAFANSSYGFAGGGQSGFTTNYYDMYMYDGANDQWSPIANAPMLGAAWSSVFVIGNIAYAGLGAKFVSGGLTGTDIFYTLDMQLLAGINNLSSSKDINIFFNQTEKKLIIEGNSSEKLQVNIYDATGKNVFNKSLSVLPNNISDINLSTGIYIVKINSDHINYSTKLFIH